MPRSWPITSLLALLLLSGCGGGPYPRLGIDDDPANQCRRFRDGEAHHFVELTPEGEVIRAQ